MIQHFRGHYSFLSNFYKTSLEYNGLTFKNSEASFHAQKTLDEDLRKQFQDLGPIQAKRAGRSLELRPDWESVKIQIMHEILLAKFSQNEELKEKLLATGDEELVEGNYWQDNFWGSCTCKKCQGLMGQNHLGKLLMQVRSELRGS